MKMKLLYYFVIAVILAILMYGFSQVTPSKRFAGSEKEVTATEKSYDWGYSFPVATEFGESDHYSMVWIGESGFIWKRFLLVKAKEVHRDYGPFPYLLKAIPDVERKGYTIVSKEFLSTGRGLEGSGSVDSLLLKIRPPENTEDTGKRHP